MRAVLTLIVVAIIFFAGGAAYDLYVARPPSPAAVEAQADASEWERVPDFQVVDLNNHRINMKDWRGKPVILSFWATWCTTCVIEFPMMLEYAARHNGDVILLALASDKDAATVNRFIDKLKPNIRDIAKKPFVHIALDRERRITRDVFLTERYPETIFITADGRMARKTIGITDWKKIAAPMQDWGRRKGR